MQTNMSNSSNTMLKAFQEAAKSFISKHRQTTGAYTERIERYTMDLADIALNLVKFYVLSSERGLSRDPYTQASVRKPSKTVVNLYNELSEFAKYGFTTPSAHRWQEVIATNIHPDDCYHGEEPYTLGIERNCYHDMAPDGSIQYVCDCIYEDRSPITFYSIDEVFEASRDVISKIHALMNELKSN